jgi:hypothetical protein
VALRAITMDDVDRLVALDTISRSHALHQRWPADTATAARVERSLGHRWLAFERDGGVRQVVRPRPSGHRRELATGCGACWGHGLRSCTR